MDNVTPIHFWEVYEFPWGTAVRERRTGRWTHVFLSPDGQEIRVDGLDVALHDNGIEFVVVPREV